MGVDNVERIRKDAQIAKANAERDVSVAKSIAAKEANDAEVAAQLEIAKKRNDLRIKQAELKKESDTQMSIAEAAKGIMDEEQRKVREIKAGDANVAAQEKIIELKEREISITEKQLDAQVKKKADADKYAVQMRSDAALYAIEKEAMADLVKRQKNAEAEQFEIERQSDAKKAMAEADKVKGENEAAVIRAKGEAEAEAIRLKGIAEAEALEKKADAMAKYGEAAKMDLQLQVAKAFVEQLPAVATGVAEAYSKVDSIVMYGDQSAKLAGNVINTTTQLAEGLGRGLGIDLKSMLAGAFGTKLLDVANKAAASDK
jgi:flotillin